MAQPELLDPQIDVRHHLYRFAVQGEELLELMKIDEHWIPRFVNFEFTIPYGLRHDICR